MPELPDVEIYREALVARVAASQLRKVVLKSPFVLRTAVPPLDALFGKRVKSVARLGKRIVFGFDDDYFLVVHLMIAGRLQWLPESKQRGGGAPAKITLALLEFTSGTLALTEAGTRKRASLHCVHGRDALAAFDAGGLDVMSADRDAFAGRLRSENHTLKRALTDPHLFSGIGNAYSDEILHAPKLSPLALSQKLDDEEGDACSQATRGVLTQWTGAAARPDRRAFPEKVTAFHAGMAVHGRLHETMSGLRRAGPAHRVRRERVQLLRACQTAGGVLADRALSRLLHKSFKRSLDDD